MFFCPATDPRTIVLTQPRKITYKSKLTSCYSLNSMKYSESDTNVIRDHYML